jgi:hypothetical protein
MSWNFSTRLFLRISQQNSGSDSDYSHVCFLIFLSVSCPLEELFCEEFFFFFFFFCYGRKINHSKPQNLLFVEEGGVGGECGPVGKAKRGPGGGGEGCM